MKSPTLKKLKSSPLAIGVIAVSGVVVLLGGGSAYAAQSNALPGNPLYPFKQLWERGSLLLSFSPTAKAQTHLNIAQDRIKAVQANQTPGPVLAPTLKTVQENLNNALNQSTKVSDQSVRKEIKKSISDTAAEAEKEVEKEAAHEKEPAHVDGPDDSSSTDDKSIKSVSDEIKKVQDKASKDD